MSDQSNPFLKPDGTKPSCMQMLQMILDEEATSDQKNYFRHHMDKCIPCFKAYEVDITIKEMLQVKCCCDQVSMELVEQLKNEIKQKITS
jgi:mycothiol system anti-sigma-R factor